MLRHVFSQRILTNRCFSVSLRSSSITSFVSDLSQRSLIANSYPSNLLNEHADNVKSLPPSIYAGFDPTAESLHIGNLLVLLNLLRASQFNIQPIAIVGGATATIGDPSGRDTERDEVQLEIIHKQAESIKLQLERIARNTLENSSYSLKILNNYEWFKNMSMIEYLRTCKLHRMGEMLRMGAIKNRMSENSGISFTEFSYQTMQSYDWYHLSKTQNCFFQIGGSDQLGHLDLGAHYIKRCSSKFAAGLCLPLVTDSSGKKLGKSVGGAVWLCPQKTSPFHFFQFFRQLHDSEAERLFMQFSLQPYEEIISVLKEHRENLGRWIVQEALARELTLAVHGQEGLDMAVRCTRALYFGTMEDVVLLDQEQLISIFGVTTKVSRSLTTMGELACSTRSDKQKGDVLMTKGAFKVNGKKIINPLEGLNFSTLILPKTKNLTLICWGKRKFQLLEWI